MAGWRENEQREFWEIVSLLYKWRHHVRMSARAWNASGREGRIDQNLHTPHSPNGEGKLFHSLDNKKMKEFFLPKRLKQGSFNIEPSPLNLYGVYPYLTKVSNINFLAFNFYRASPGCKTHGNLQQPPQQPLHHGVQLVESIPRGLARTSIQQKTRALPWRMVC